MLTAMGLLCPVPGRAAVVSRDCRPDQIRVGGGGVHVGGVGGRHQLGAAHVPAPRGCCGAPVEPTGEDFRRLLICIIPAIY